MNHSIPIIYGLKHCRWLIIWNAINLTRSDPDDQTHTILLFVATQPIFVVLNRLDYG